jgi:predicted metal-dependent HD superfamily phosphohydrolase
MNFTQLNTQFKEIAAPYYSDLLYHNLKHAQEVQQNAHRIAQLLNMTEFEQLAVCRAAWMHDAGYHLPLDKSLYATKEDLSIALMKQESELLFTKQYPWIKEQIIKRSTEAINGTKIERSDFSSPFAKILRAADIVHLGTPNTEEFLIGSAKIYHEYTFLNQEHLEKEWLLPIPQRIFQWKQTEILELLLNNCIQWIPETPYFPEWFYEQFKTNIDTLRNIDDFQQYIDLVAEKHDINYT